MVDDNAAIGAGGTGVTAFDGCDTMLLPIELFATTTNRYEMPLVSPVTECVNAIDPSSLSTPPAGIEPTRYPVIGLPPSLFGAAKVTVAVPSDPIAMTLVGTPGGELTAVTKRSAI